MERIEVAELTGHRPDSWLDAETELENFVLTDQGRHDAELVIVFHRRLHRARMLNGPAGSWITQHRDAPQPSL